MQVQVHTTDNWSPTLQRYAASRRGGPDAVRKAVLKAAQYTVSYAMQRIPRADKAKIRADLMAPARNARFDVKVQKLTPGGKESRAKRYQELKGTLAAYLVWLTNYKNARQMEGAAFWGTVGKYVANRQRAAGHHRSGMIPALKAFKVARGLADASQLPRWQHMPGSASITPEGADVAVANMANFAKAIGEIAPEAFALAEAETQRQLIRYTQENLMTSMRAAGIQDVR